MKNSLFVGNSYTYYSDMPEALFAPMAKAAGFECTVTMVAVIDGQSYTFDAEGYAR